MKLIELFSCDATALDVKAKDKDAVINKLVDLQFTHGNITDKEAYKKQFMRVKPNSLRM